jgi:phosphoglycolate phosphatase
MQLLVLFDIDGTLVRRAGPHHRQALVDAIRQVTGAETTTEGIPVHGMLDPDILTIMLQTAGVTEAEIIRLLPQIQEAAQDLYDPPPDLQDKVCPGAKELLEELSENKVLKALVTGNLTRIGWRKLERAGLAGYFDYGQFGEQAETRAGLARQAIAKARAEYGLAAQARISLIGDAPQDIEAAKANGIQSIAVSTGLSPKEELAGHKPDILVDDLSVIRVNPCESVAQFLTTRTG